MKINKIVQTPNFTAKVRVPNPHKNSLYLGKNKELTKKLESSNTQNIYELISTNNNSYDVLLNNNKLDSLEFKPSDGYFGLITDFLNKCVQKENEVCAKINPEIASKLESLRTKIKEYGLSIEDVKNWL